MNQERIELLKKAISLSSIKGLTPYDIKKLMLECGGVEEIYSSTFNKLYSILSYKRKGASLSYAILQTKDFSDAQRCIEYCLKKGVFFLLYSDLDYPSLLRQIPDPPLLLYGKGSFKRGEDVCISIVGTRRATNYGKGIARWISKELSRCGITVVSGLARGIDTEAHKGALEGGGKTVAVLGTGIDITYPYENRGLREKIETQGAVLTEFPPKTSPKPWRFPMRNRIIAGMSYGTLVIEAPKKSGALITARLALEYNRDVFAVPGDIRSASSVGCNDLIKEGAKPVMAVSDILEELGISVKEEEVDVSPSLSPEEEKVWNAIGERGEILEKIIYKSGISPPNIFSILLKMEMKGWVCKMPGNFYVRSV